MIRYLRDEWYAFRCSLANRRKRRTRGTGRRLLACFLIVAGYSLLNGTVPAIFLARARATDDLWFYGLWFAALLVFAVLGGLGCASVYAEGAQER